MHTELKKAITEFVFENLKEFQLNSATTKKFRQYIFTPEGQYCIGGKEVSEFISEFIELIRK